MPGKINTLIDMICLKLKHPSVKTNGVHYIKPGTEIIVKSKGKLIIGRWVQTNKRVTFTAIGGELSIGKNTTFNRNDIIISRDKITIGDNCSFGPNVCVYDHDHKFDKQGTKNRGYNTSPVIIEDNCWIGANVVILRGTHVGKGCVIGAGTVIKGDIPPLSLVKSDRKLEIQKIE